MAGSWTRVQNTFGNSGAAAATSASSTLTATTQGDMLLFAIVLGTAGTVTPPAGWNLITSLNITGGGSVAVFVQYNVNGGVTTSGAFTFPSSLAVWCCVEYGGITSFNNIPGGSNLVDQILAVNNGTGTNFNSGSTPQLGQYDDLVVCFNALTWTTTNPGTGSKTNGFSEVGNSVTSAASNNPKIILYEMLSVGFNTVSCSGTLNATPVSGPATILITFLAGQTENIGGGPAPLVDVP